MKHADKNRDPERARKRALADFNCAVRKLIEEARSYGYDPTVMIQSADTFRDCVRGMRGEE